MNGVGEGIGAAIEGGILSRAVEPSRGEATGAPPATSECLNCGAMVTGPYCGECGQKAHVHRSLAAIGHDIMHGVLHLDGKLWNTLPLLTFKPGQLTRRYIEGERAKFVSPMAMFLFSVFAMFAVFQMVGLSVADDFAEGWANYEQDKGQPSAFTENIRKQIQTLERERASLARNDPRRIEIDNELKGLQTILDGSPLDLDDQGSIEFTATGIETLDNGLIEKWKKNPSLMLYKLQANGYKFSWLLIPLSLPFVWLMFAWRRRYKAYDHAVFVTYSLAFMSLLFIAISLISAIPGGGGWAVALFMIGAPLHLYKQLRYAYGLTQFSTTWRLTVLLLFAMPIVLLAFVLILGVLGAF
ncbi:DUF3667 domain-containing protein [Erythrobacter dokdonensis]|uniref:DUF3667 domain-containing protein n=1 Tax=Erythrobacter dokdonensis DSW-74 TaxID=1300349 RepID=A0A1A7BIG2_9SPHN|nr:DUF3667 domain-containing protein [Erythrobacter dokdonensis]OBV11237.1 DUF3667 domain-containing protein [Erythrobacter dokdonensis DSW-74]